MKKYGKFSYSTGKYNGNFVGQNIFYFDESFTGDKFVDKWYESEKKYNYQNPNYSSKTGDFTQIVWKNTKKIGCGYACNGKKCYGICTYYPPGNSEGEFSSNVFPKK